MKKQIQEDLALLATKLSELGKGSSSAGALKGICADIYDRLCILEYLEAQLETDPKGQGSASFDSKSFREQNWFVEPEPVPQPEHQEDLVEPLMEKIKDIVAQMPQESEQVDALLERVLPTDKKGVMHLEEIASEYQKMPVFERKEQQDDNKSAQRVNERQSARPRSLNEQVAMGIKIGLNDRLAFVNKLFNGSSEDYNRVISQISTMNSLEEIRSFVERQVKPDYDWSQQQELESRFMNLLERGFN
jgi:hypothetical protein